MPNFINKNKKKNIFFYTSIPYKIEISLISLKKKIKNKKKITLNFRDIHK